MIVCIGKRNICNACLFSQVLYNRDSTIQFLVAHGVQSAVVYQNLINMVTDIKKKKKKKH